MLLAGLLRGFSGVWAWRVGLRWWWWAATGKACMAGCLRGAWVVVVVVERQAAHARPRAHPREVREGGAAGRRSGIPRWRTKPGTAERSGLQHAPFFPPSNHTAHPTQDKKRLRAPARRAENPNRADDAARVVGALPAP